MNFFFNWYDDKHVFSSSSFQVFKAENASETDQNHRVIESILHLFSGFDAFCLPPPFHKKEHIKDTWKYRDKQNPDFFTEVKRFAEFVKSIMGPKKSCNKGELVTGEGISFLRNHVQSEIINLFLYVRCIHFHNKNYGWYDISQ